MLQVPVTVDTFNAGQLNFDSDAIRRLSSLRPGMISITANHSQERRAVEAFIEGIYAKTYGAVIAQHYPMLVSVQDKTGRILAALGFRAAGTHTVFLEHYMDAPVEHAVSGAFKCEIARQQIVEVGNLGSAGHGAAIFLFVALMAYLQRMGFSHLVLTGTNRLRGYFEKLGVDPRDMGAADPHRLPDQGVSWGSYYKTDPRLIAGDIACSYARLQKVMLVEQVCASGFYQTQFHPQA